MIWRSSETHFVYLSTATRTDRLLITGQLNLSPRFPDFI
jgi:hypothetical protein